MIMASKDVVITSNVECATLVGISCSSKEQIDNSCTLSDKSEG